MARQITDISGERYGRLTAESYAGNGKWVCRCDCGGMTIAATTNLRKGDSQSCGCLHRERASATHRRHGRTNTPEYKAWRAMKHRCLNPNATQYDYYGGRGITISERWVTSFENFFSDMGPRPTRGHSVDRIDNDGPYAPGNCRWADRSTQVTNSRTARLITFDGITDTVVGWSKRLGWKTNVLHHRLDRGWDLQRTMTQPPRVN